MLDQIRPAGWNFTAVEIDDEVCDLAAIYGYPKISSDINTITTDAFTYVQIVEDSYDIICVDLFIGDNTPQKFRTQLFLEDIKALCNPDGYVIYNAPAFNEIDKKISLDFFNNEFRPVFQGSTLINAHRNYMLVWQNITKEQ